MDCCVGFPDSTFSVQENGKSQILQNVFEMAKIANSNYIEKQ
jgi:hypothetical protein